MFIFLALIKELNTSTFRKNRHNNRKLEIVFMKHYVPNHLLAHEDGALLAIPLIILNQLTKYEASIYNNL